MRMNRRSGVIAGAVLLVLGLAALVTRREDKTESVPPAASATPGKSEAPAKKYKMKSGIIVSKSDAIGETTQTLYFDDYGAREATYTATEMKFGDTVVRTGSVEIRADGYYTKYDTEKKEGDRWSLNATGTMPAGGGGNMPDIASLVSQPGDMQIEQLETRTIAGKEAQGYGMDWGGMKVRGWTWENISMRSELYMGKEPMVTEVTSVQVDVPVPADKFKVPADVKIAEHK